MYLPIFYLPSINRILLTLAFVCLLAVSAGVILVGAHKDDRNVPSTTPADPLNAPDKTRIASHFGQLPLSFEINKGQLDDAVKFMSHGAGYDLFLTANETVLRLHKLRGPDENVREGTVLRLKLRGAST